MKIIDGKNAVLGRLSSLVAKDILAGEEICVVNAEKIIITGKPKVAVKKYIERRQRGSPQHGPFFPRQPEAIVRRTIRGMIPYKTSRGRAAMKKLRVYRGVPESLKDEKLNSLATKRIRSKFIRVEGVAKTLGWHE